MKRPRTAFTLTEVVIAASITVVIGLAVTSVSLALSDIHAHSEEYYGFLQTGRVAASRLQETLRKARLITASSSGSLVIWADDQRDLGQINVSEVIMVYYDPVTKKLMERSIIFPDNLPDETRQALDGALSLTTVTNANIADGAFGLPQYDLRRVLAQNVLDFRVYCDVAPPMARLVKFRLKVGRPDNTVRISGGATLRADKTSYVGLSDGSYILSIPPEHLGDEVSSGSVMGDLGPGDLRGDLPAGGLPPPPPLGGLLPGDN